MKLLALFSAGLTASAVLVASPASADRWHGRDHHGHGWKMKRVCKTTWHHGHKRKLCRNVRVRW